eukprot:scaffold11724_cov148-Skeletonema_menzelii.AAC.2
MINANNYNDDEVQSDDFSDFDQPYHETASDWFRRSARRRARRLAGVSSCSSSDESVDEGFDGEMNAPSNSNNTSSNAALKPIIKWQRQYPIAAASACLALSYIDTAIGHGSTRSPRERECNRLYRVFNKLRRQQQQQRQHNDGDNTPTIENDKLVIDSFLPRGTGISIIDSALSRETRRQGTSSSSLVFEMTGNRRSGKTTTLVAIAARYVASTTNSFFRDLLECEATNSAAADGEGDLNHRPSKRQRRQGNNMHTYQSVIEPRVVMLDIDHCINPIKLMIAVREAVLRRFHETSVARKWIRELRANTNTQEDATKTISMEEDPEAQLYDELSAREKERIERTIVSCLGRINIVQPRDFTYLSLVATLECLRQSMDNEKKDNNQKHAPTLIMIDSMSTLDAATQFQESLPAGKGSSDRNEFYRQLIRLRDSHEVAIIGTSLTTAGRCSIWEKIVSHRISIEQGMNWSL